MERIGAHKLDQTSLSLSLRLRLGLCSSLCYVFVTSLRLQVTSLHMPLLHPSENRAIFVLTCVLLVSGGFITDSQDKGVERGSEPVAFIEHIGKAVLSAVTCTKDNTLLSFGKGADVLLWVILTF